MQLAVIALANTFIKCIYRYREKNFTIYMLFSCDL